MAKHEKKHINTKNTASTVDTPLINSVKASLIHEEAHIPDIKPMPWKDVPIPKGFSLSHRGLFKTGQEDNNKMFISGPIWVHAVLEDAQSAKYGMLLCWYDIKQQIQRQPFDMSLLHEQSNTIIKELGGLGLQINPGKGSALREYLNYSITIRNKFILSASNLGWFSTNSDPNQLTYVLPPDRVISQKEGESIIFKPERHSPTIHTIRSSGKLDSWKENVAEPCKGNPMLTFALCVPFAAPLLKLTNIDSFGFHFYGLSSTGKTTAAQVAASVFGCGADPADSPDQAYIQRWNSTSNAFEGLAAAHNDGLLVLDELHTCESRDFAAVIYNLLGGKGKSRMTKDAQLRKISTWRTILFSTGEISAKRKVEETGQQSLAGQRNRLLDIPIGNDNIIENTGTLSKGEFALKLKNSCSQYYGHPGPLFIEWIISKYDSSPAARHVIEHRLGEIVNTMGLEFLTAPQGRAIRRIALVMLAGYMAIEAGVLPYTKKQITDSANYVKNCWLQDDANVPEHIQGAIKIQEFFMKNKARFINLSVYDQNTPRDIAGYIHNEGVVFSKSAMTEVLEGLDERNILNFLKITGLLVHEKGRLYKKIHIDGLSRPRMIVIKEDFFSEDFIGTSGTLEQH